jgi:drug/metabolite transporter (DMT)-like permease
VRFPNPLGGQQQPLLALAVSATIVLWASAFVAIRSATRWFGPAELAFFRFAIASLAFLLWAPFARKAWPNRHDLLVLLGAGGLGIAAYNVLLNAGERRVDAGTAAILVNTGPLWVAVFALVFLGERAGPRLLLGMLVSFSGVWILSGGAAVRAPGGALILLAAVAQATQFVLQRPLLGRLDPALATACAIWAGTLFLLPVAPSLAGQLTDVSTRSILVVAYLALFPGALAYFAWGYALARVEAASLARTLYLVPLVTIALSWTLLGERPPARALPGGAFAIAGALIGRQRPPPAPRGPRSLVPSARRARRSDRCLRT